MTRLSIYVDDLQYRHFRIGCLQHGFTMSELIRAFITETLHRWQTEEAPISKEYPEKPSS